MRWKLAVLNTFRNRRRTALNLVMIGGGVMSILLFEGFARNVLDSLKETTIQTQSGHLQVASDRYWSKQFQSPREKLLQGYPEKLQEIRALPEVSYASGRLEFFGLLSRGDLSLSARGVSFDPKVESKRNAAFDYLSGRALRAQPAKGQASSDDDWETDRFQGSFEVVVGKGLAQRLQIKDGANLTILSNTYDGIINAIDVEVVGIFQTGIAEFDDVTFLMPLGAAQTLLDTQEVEQIVIGLHDTDQTETVHAALKSRWAGVETKSWIETATLYRQIASFNKVQNRVIALIILILTILSILNTVGMSIMERTGEIGTTRALGETRWSVCYQFILEGLVLGGLGAFLGAVLGVSVATWINYLGVELVMPGASTTLKVHIDLVPPAFVVSLVISLVAATGATLLPAIRASRLNIATALRQNI